MKVREKKKQEIWLKKKLKKKKRYQTDGISFLRFLEWIPIVKVIT